MKNLIAVILIALVILFVVQNMQIVEVRVLIWKISLSRALLIVGTFLAGLGAGALLRRAKR